MIVTVICDASFCHDTHAAGYGFFVASDRKRFSGGAPMHRNPPTSVAAELFAIANSVVIAFRENVAGWADHVKIQTDCEGAIQALEGRREVLAAEAIAVRLVRDLLARNCCTFEVIHVKGHSSNSNRGGRFVSNRLCDSRARYHMRERRKQIAHDEAVKTLTERGILDESREDNHSPA